MAEAASRPCAGCGRRRAAGNRTLAIASENDTRPLVVTWRRFDDVRIVAAGLSGEERDAWEDRLLGLYTECGCHMGGIATLLAIVVVIGVTLAAEPLSGFAGAAAGIGVIFGAALAGKAIGIAAARFRLRNEVRRLGAVLSVANTGLVSANR